VFVFQYYGRCGGTHDWEGVQSQTFSGRIVRSRTRYLQKKAQNKQCGEYAQRTQNCSTGGNNSSTGGKRRSKVGNNSSIGGKQRSIGGKQRSIGGKQRSNEENQIVCKQTVKM
jgi:hypothetical protein